MAPLRPAHGEQPDAVPLWLADHAADLESALSACLLEIPFGMVPAASYGLSLWRWLEASPLSVLVSDAAGVITYANPAFAALCGYPVAELVGQTPRLFRSGLHNPDYYAVLWETLRRGEPWRGLLVNRCCGGALCHCQVEIRPVGDASGRVHHYVALYREVGHPWAPARRAEMQGMTNLAAETVHDVNNLLTILSGYSQLMVEEFEQGTRAHHEAERIYATCRRAAEMMRQLLLFSGRQAQRQEKVDLAEWSEGQIEDLAEIVGPAVHLHFEAQVAPEVLADPELLRVALINLVRNASEAMPEGGRLRLITDITALDRFSAARLGLSEGLYAVLCVEDDGRGVSAEAQRHMFEPFYSTKRGVGSGLGLAVVYGIVTQAGGAVAVNSEPGRGTCVSVYLPCVGGAEG
jgi:PAS domain S-box-containing protein